MKRDRTHQADRGGAPSPRRAGCGRALPILALLSGVGYLSIVHAAFAVTLENVLQTTLEKNPVIQEAKMGLEQATGQRLVFRSVAWPRAGRALLASDLWSRTRRRCSTLHLSLPHRRS